MAENGHSNSKGYKFIFKVSLQIPNWVLSLKNQTSEKHGFYKIQTIS